MNLIHDYIATALVIGIIKVDIKDPEFIDQATCELYDDIMDLYFEDLTYTVDDWQKLVLYVRNEINLEKNLN